jgi:hypothetical protein
MNRVMRLPSVAVVFFLSGVVALIAQEHASDILSEASAVTSPSAESPSVDETAAQQGTSALAETTDHVCQCVSENNSRIVIKIQEALASPLHSAGLGFSDAPLQQVVQVIEDEYGFPVRLDLVSLDEIGLGPDEPVNFSMTDISLRSALRLMLQQLQLTYIIRNEVLIITTPETAEQELVVCVYDVREIIGSAKDQSVDQLINAIVSCVSTDTWAENGGGEAEVRWLQPGYLVISQTPAVHEEIRALLVTIRDVRRRSSLCGDESAAAVGTDDNYVTTRFYPLKLGASAQPDEVRLQIHNLITDSLPDEHWKGKLADGQPVVLTILPDRVR